MYNKETVIRLNTLDDVREYLGITQPSNHTLLPSFTDSY